MPPSHMHVRLLPHPPAGASWSTTPLPPEERSVLSLRTSYITRVEGCNGHNAIARLTLQTASGARYSQGRGNCLGFFMEEVGASVTERGTALNISPYLNGSDALHPSIGHSATAVA